MTDRLKRKDSEKCYLLDVTFDDGIHLTSDFETLQQVADYIKPLKGVKSWSVEKHTIENVTNDVRIVMDYQR